MSVCSPACLGDICSLCPFPPVASLLHQLTPHVWHETHALEASSSSVVGKSEAAWVSACSPLHPRRAQSHALHLQQWLWCAS